MIKYDVFISYSRKDKKIIDGFCEILSKTGIKYWVDYHGIDNGEEFKTVIVKAIEESCVFLFFASKNSNASIWTAKEIGIAVSKGKHIIPIKLDYSSYNKAVEFDLVNIDFVDFTNKLAREQGRGKLIATIKNKCSDVKRNDTYDSSSVIRTHPNRTFSKFTKMFIGLGIAIICFFAIMSFCHSEDSGSELAPKDTIQVDEFLYAKRLLDSDIKDSVRKGYDKMLSLVNKGDNCAKLEIGLTNYGIQEQLLSDSLLIRRKHLEMGNKNIEEQLDLVESCLTTIKDSTVLCPEMYYILGAVYFDKNKFENAKNAFEEGLELLRKGYFVSHGYNESLRFRLEDNIKMLQN